jgi:hypothetical protein
MTIFYYNKSRHSFYLLLSLWQFMQRLHEE